MNIKIITIITFLILSGCSSNKDYYYWGNYENLVYKTHHTPAEATPLVQIEALTADIQKAEAKGKPIAPGIYAQLGFMYATQGNTDMAVAALKTEKSLYPSSAVLIDGMISRVTKNTNKEG